MEESLWPEFWDSLCRGEINWDIFYELESQERKEAVSWLIKRDFVLSSSEKVEEMTFSSEWNIPKMYVVRYKTGRILNPANSVNFQETLYFRKDLYAKDYRTYLLNADLKNTPLKLEVEELNRNLVYHMRTCGLFNFNSEHPDHPSH